VDFDNDRGSFRIFGNPFEVLYEDIEPTLQFKLINLHCSNELRSQFKEGDLLKFYMCFPEDKYSNLWQKVSVHACFFESTCFLIDESK
jgi:hypothetical protein